jgi:hypothetical protein
MYICFLPRFLGNASILAQTSFAQNLNYKEIADYYHMGNFEEVSYLLRKSGKN